MDIVADVLKWIIIILIAGFIGQFGKSLSLHIIDYYKKKKLKSKSAGPLVPKEEAKKPIPSSITADPTTEKESSIVPRVKDAPAEKDFVLEPQEMDGKTVKKALKAQQKAQKKMEKAKQKAPE
jgi:hypothetical protein